MSRHNEINITCPGCGKESPFTVWQSVNTVIDPQMKQAVADMSAFIFECPSCGKKTLTVYSFLYHQQEDSIMIYYAANEDEEQTIYRIFSGEEKDSMFDGLTREGYKLRIVGSLEDLAEKINIFDRKLDDRIIEIFKIHALAMYRDRRRGSGDVRMLFTSHEGRDYLKILENGKPEGVCEITEENYRAIRDKYAGRLSDEMSNNIYIDNKWAMELMGLH